MANLLDVMSVFPAKRAGIKHVNEFERVKTELATTYTAANQLGIF